MKLSALTLFFILNIVSFYNLFGQTYSLDWVKQMGGLRNDEGIDIAVDIDGNVLTVGSFNLIVDFDPGQGIFELDGTNSQVMNNIFIQKLDKNGDFIWVKQIKDVYATSITTDEDGNVYVLGFFNHYYGYEKENGEMELGISKGGQDIFIHKLTPNGDLVWAKQFGGISEDFGSAMTIDQTGNLYVTGRFYDTIEFNLINGTEEIVAIGENDIFILKIDRDGTYLWVKQIGGTGSDFGTSITVDYMGNSITTGSFRNKVNINSNLGNIHLESRGAEDILFVKLDTKGNYIWAKEIGGLGDDIAFSVSTDPLGNLYTTGAFHDVVDFDPGIGVFNLSSYGHRDMYIQKLDQHGNFLWTKQVGSGSLEYGISIVTDKYGNSYSTVRLQEMADFNPGIETDNIICQGFSGVFILRLDAKGDYINTIIIDGPFYEIGRSLTFDKEDNLYITGLFEGACDFDPGIGAENLTSQGGADIFVQKLKVIKSSFSYSVLVYPNPSDSEFSIRFDKTYEKLVVRLLSMQGNEIQKINFYNADKISILVEQPPGMYLLEVTDGGINRIAVKIFKE